MGEEHKFQFEIVIGKKLFMMLFYRFILECELSFFILNYVFSLSLRFERLLAHVAAFSFRRKTTASLAHSQIALFVSIFNLGNEENGFVLGVLVCFRVATFPVSPKTPPGL